MEQSFDFVVKAIQKTCDNKGFRPLNVNALNFGNAGATIVQELAFAMSMGNEYLANLTEKGISVDDLAGSMRFNFSIGSNYFMEIAKLRAARLLWANIVKEYRASEDAGKMYIHCETAEWNKTIYDPYVNLLRTQTEAMSAVLGGTQSLTVLPFDIFYKEPDEFSERIARNQQLLLKEESYFDKVEDIPAGSYYIENLTDSIAAEAWKLFTETEEKGGYLNALRSGFIQEQIRESADKRRKAIATRRENLLGTNEYPNITEKIVTQIERVKEYPGAAEDAEVEPIQLFRSAEEYEELRLATERSGKDVKVFMLTFGNLAMRLARSQFSGNFFGCAGYSIIDNIGFDSVEQGIEEAKKAGADIVVLCSSDDEYTDAAPKALELLNSEAMLVVAGAPKNMDELKAKGVEHFIHLRSNVLETLKMFNERLIK
jgi:methylmalonyl-CoA mutase